MFCKSGPRFFLTYMLFTLANLSLANQADKLIQSVGQQNFCANHHSFEPVHLADKKNNKQDKISVGQTSANTKKRCPTNQNINKFCRTT